MPIEWNAILVEEAGEASQTAINGYFGNEKFYYEYRNEMIQMAAVALAMIELFVRLVING